MARKKVKLAWITNNATRRATFKKRKKGLVKKVSELATLCGVESCLVVYGPQEAADVEAEVEAKAAAAAEQRWRYLSRSAIFPYGQALHEASVEFLGSARITIGVKFHKVLCVPNQSVYNKVSSDATAPTADAHQSDLSWQLTLQRVWQNLIRSEQDPGDTSECGGSLVFPSLPLAIKWLRESSLQNRSTQFQVLVTGSLHLVGDVLRLIRK